MAPKTVEGANGMRTLLVKHRNNWCEDCCDGITMGLSPLIYQTGTYLRKESIDVTTLEYDKFPADLLQEHDCLVLFVSLAGLDDNLYHLKVAKERGLHTVLILHDSFCAEEELMADHDFVDFCIVYPEREITLKELLRSLEAKMWNGVPGTVWRGDGRPCRAETRMPSPDLKHLSSCTEILAPVLANRSYTHAYLTVGRGCPHGCSFCDLRRTPVRKRSPKHIAEELTLFQKYAGLRDLISFIDPFFGVDLQWTETLCEEILRKGIRVSWRATTRYDVLPDIPLLKLWRRAGCMKMGLGLEHLGHPRLKKVDPAEFRTAVERLQKCSILPVVSVIIGLWEDDAAALSELEDYLLSLGRVEVIATPLMPLKGTPLYEEYKTKKVIHHEWSYKDYQKWGYAEVMLPTEHLRKDEVSNWMQRFHSFKGSHGGSGMWRKLAVLFEKVNRVL
jgi:hypothetical protein